MSEEQSNFKITDRRLFNADGTPRDVERVEEAPEVTGPANTPAQAETTQPPPEVPDAGATGGATGTASAPPEQKATASEEAPGASGEEALPDAENPASFINFLMSIASNAAASLGMMEHPVTGERGVDLQLAKHWIDVLGMLQQKTRGNLHPQEHQIFESLLSDLRMQYVSLTGSQRTAPAGFTGRDIIGGK